ncbi:protein mono-ADP-ribosyltransferase PARP3-like [Panulirus ornatus]|uniref:protein mono-ADP-ribosyltransferase PARP3-like n=1 Tax=Panulirus ornatus TaxID=150431 RepID=UPI003A8B6C8F
MPYSGGHVGEGIYFASQFVKSIMYVRPYHGMFEREDMIGFLFLVEVALGNEFYLTEHCSHISKAPDGYDSIVAKGRKESDPKRYMKMNFEGKEVVVPLGKPLNQKRWSHSVFEYNEYIIYKESQARIRYMVKFSFS